LALGVRRYNLCRKKTQLLGVGVVLTLMDIADGFAVLVNAVHVLPVFHIHVCPDEIAAFSNAMPHLGQVTLLPKSAAGFLKRILSKFTKHNHPHCKHVCDTKTGDDSCPS